MAKSYDSETWLIRPGLLAPPLVSISTFDGQEPKLFLKAEGIESFRKDLASSTTIIGHNGPYDWAVFANYDEELLAAIFAHFEAGLFRDTKVRQQLLDIADGRKSINGTNQVFRDGRWQVPDYSLAGLELLHLKVDRKADKQGEDVWRFKYHELDDVPVEKWPEDAKKYALDDAIGTYKVWEKQGPECLTNERQQVYADFCLHLASVWGIRTSGESVKKLEGRLLKEQQRVRQKLIQVGFLSVEKATKKKKEDGTHEYGAVDFWAPAKGQLYPFRYKKESKKIQAFVERTYNKKGKSLKYTETGKISTDKDTLEESGSPLLKSLAGIGGIDKLLTTYIPVLKQGIEVPINARFNVLVNSGRTSCSNPNLQNIPSGRIVAGTRECYVARAGYKLASIDFDTFELRALAQVCLWLFGWSRMAEALQAGRELHDEFAADILEISYDEFIKRKKAGDSEAKLARDFAKVFNFGGPGGLGAASMVDYARGGYNIRITEKKAYEFLQRWKAKFPEMVLFFKYISKLVGIDTATITQPWSLRVRGNVGYCDGCNTLFQGLAADAAKEALTQVSRLCYTGDTALFGSRILVFIHDELLLEVPEEVLTEASDLAAKTMCTAAMKVITDIPITASPAAMDIWYKNAKEVRIDGKLIPWKP